MLYASVVASSAAVKRLSCTVLGMLLEGMSIRACERLTGVNRDTICDLILTVGDNCARFLDANVHNVPAEVIELDEIWGFVGCKEKTRTRLECVDDCGVRRCDISCAARR